MTIDREGLKQWYRGAMMRRLEELRGLRSGLQAGDSSACDAARSVGQALRGSGATYGYPEVSALSTLVESAPDSEVHRRVEGLIEHLHGLAARDDAPGETVWAEWLLLAAEGGGRAPDSPGFSDIARAWQEVAAGQGISPEDLAARVAAMFRLQEGPLPVPNKAALRLVPEALIRSAGILPLREDSERITVATVDPVSLRMEEQLGRLTGRTPVLVVATPGELERAIADSLDAAEGDGERAASEGQAAAARRGSSSMLSTAEQDDVHGDRVLIVDDDPGALLMARGMLLKGGYDVEEAGDGLEALERLDADRGIRLVVADLNMPRLDGLELIWEIRAKEDWRRIPVIVVTGQTDEVLETKLIEEGADDYIRKPLDPRLFLARVAATIRRAEH
ncbi:MAG: response regulator [Gemmatimonadota bacterium]